jgi:CRP-like cAMP-binding protein
MSPRHHHDPKVDQLSDLDLFRHCTRSELEGIAEICTEVQLGQGRVVVRQGEFEYEFFVIVEGDASVDVDGEQIAKLGRGTFFGEQALISHGARNATVTAMTPLRALVFNRAEFNTMMRNAPHAASDMMEEISRRVNETS